jgi:membrane-associated protease RseP (regulator of RpoE activity)
VDHVGDAVYNALDSLDRFMQHTPFFPTILWFVLGFLAAALSTLVHELGHALAARREGVPVRALASEPEGPAVTFRRSGTFVRIGLGLGRDLKSRAPRGFVRLHFPDWITPEAAIRILRAGPLAEAAYGSLLLFGAALPLPTVPRIVLLLDAVGSMASARFNLSSTRHPWSDGAQIALIRAAVAAAPAEPLPEPPPWIDPRTRHSVPPPGV